MDRHDLRGATAESVAQAHVLDLGPSAKHGVRFLSYWFDADKGAAFCLADAPRPDEMQAVHRESHGLIANEIISVSEDDVLRFLGRIREPADASQVESAFRTILFTDLQGSTALLHAVGEPAYLALLTEHDLIIRRALVAARGSRGEAHRRRDHGVVRRPSPAPWRVPRPSRMGSTPGRPEGPAPSCGSGSGSPPASRSITTTTCSVRP